MENKEYSVLIQQLLQASREGRIQWRESPRSDRFFFALSHNSISIGPWYEEEGSETVLGGYRLAIIGPKGDDLDGWALAKNETGFEQLEELHTLALRKARKIDETLKELNALLSKEKGVIGGPSGGIDPPPMKEEDIPF